MTDIHRQLVVDSPDAYLLGLGGFAINLAVNLSEEGQQEQALPSAQEKRPASCGGSRPPTLISACETPKPPTTPLWRPYWASSPAWLKAGGQDQAALDAAQESASIYRRLADADPDARLPDLARSLHTLVLRLADAGQIPVAVAVAEEAVSIRRRAADAHRHHLTS